MKFKELTPSTLQRVATTAIGQAGGVPAHAIPATMTPGQFVRRTSVRFGIVMRFQLSQQFGRPGIP